MSLHLPTCKHVKKYVSMHAHMFWGGGSVLEKKPEYHSPVSLDDYSYTKDAALDF